MKILFNEGSHLFFVSFLLAFIFYKQRMKIHFVITILFLILFFLFFRFPRLNIKENKNNVKSPCYGKVLYVYRTAKYDTIGVHLRPYDIHVQYAPISGSIKEIKTQKGIREAEKKTVLFNNEIQVDQIVHKFGYSYWIPKMLIPQRIKNWATGYIKQGKDYGMIKFGSKVEIRLPADKYNILVKPKMLLKGSKTIIATQK